MVLEIVVASGKGGVGKSILTASLAIALARRGVNLVVADADAEAPNLHIALGIDVWDHEEDVYGGRAAYIDHSLCIRCGKCYQVCRFSAIEYRDGMYIINKWICEGCMACAFVCPTKAVKPIENIKMGTLRVVYRTKYGFPLISSEIVPGRPNSGKLVTEVKNRARDMARGDTVILIDAAAGIGCPVVSSLTGASMVILVAEPTPASFSDLKRIHRLAKHFGLPAALVINKYDLNEALARELELYAYENKIDFLGVVPYDENVPRALASMKPLLEAYPDTKAVKAILSIAEKLYRIMQNWGQWIKEFKPPKPEPITLIIKRSGSST